MPWYRFIAHHGPGHQSTTVLYEWFDSQLSRLRQRAAFDRLFEDKDGPVGIVKMVRSLPKEERERKADGFRGQIAYAERMLRRLKETKRDGR